MVRLLSKSTKIFPLASILLLIILNSPSMAIVKTDGEDVKYVPDSLAFLSSDHAIVIDKTMQRLFVFHSENGQINVVYQARCSTGKNSGMKTMIGDAKTPEGIYFSTRQYSDDELSSIYGSMAFHLNYPNLPDVQMGLNGNNIWIHGTDMPLQDFQSNGCITLENNDIINISKYIKLFETPVIIYDYIKWVHPEVILSFRKELRSMLDKWIDAANTGDMTALESIYSRDTSTNKKSTNFLIKHTRKWKKRDLAISLRPKDISLLKYDNYAVIIFEQVLSLDDFTRSCGYRKLFLKKNPGNWRIIGDVLQYPMTDVQFAQNLLALDESVKTRTEMAGRQKIEELIKDWSKSWESGDMNKYRSFYAPDFTSAKMDLDGWISYKTRLSKVNKNIRIEIKNINITSGPQKGVAVFEQLYHSSRYNALGVKSLHLKKINDRWKIHRESWKAIKD